jgi:environmental stress-induced protein Ves
LRAGKQARPAEPALTEDLRLRIIRARDCRTTPWKNGGGSTTEIAAEPSGASLDTFDWRVSMARVAADGPFSAFSGIDRTLAVVKGSGLLLTIGGRAPVTLECGSDPISFAGDIATSARLVEGEIIDLNVMTRRRRFCHQLRRVVQPASSDFDGNDIAVVLSLNGSATLVSEQDVATLDHGDAAVLARDRNGSFRIAPAVAGDCYLALLREHR